MIDGIDIKLNLEKEYDVCGQKIHMPDKLPLHAVNTMADVIADIALTEDERLGTLTEDVLLIEAWIARLFIDMATDFKLDQFEGDNYDLYDALNDYDEYRDMRWAVYGAYVDLRSEKIRVYEKAHTLENTLRNITIALDGDESVRDIGMIRKMLTDLITRAKDEAAEEVKANAPVTIENVAKLGDLSKYKPKKTK